MQDFFGVLKFFESRLGLCLLLFFILPLFVAPFILNFSCPANLNQSSALEHRLLCPEITTMINWISQHVVKLLFIYLWGTIFVILFVEWLAGYKSFKLLRDFYSRQTDNFPGLSALKMVIKCLWWGDYQHVWEATRVRIEWQLWLQEKNETDSDKKEADRKKMDKKEAYFVKGFIRAYSKKIKEGLSPSNIDIQGCDDIPFDVDNCFVLTNDAKRELISNYFKAIDEINRDDLLRHKFLTEAEVTTGFLAPQQLLAGLLSEFEDDWSSLLIRFENEADHSASELQLTQMFIFYCWLLWGPSIPLGRNGPQWIPKAGGENIIAMQYGFGDENNSLPLLPLVNGGQVEDERYQTLYKYITKTPLAQAMKLKVRPVWIPREESKRESVVELARSIDKLGKAQLTALKINNEMNNEGILALDYEPTNFIEKSNDEIAGQRNYYSAYVWVMFILCKIDDGAPEHSNNDSPWLGMYPFFEHGNIADDRTYAVFKRQLAFKALASISRLLENDCGYNNTGKKVKDIYFFQYACASDHSNCPENCDVPYPKEFRSSNCIRDYIDNLLKTDNEAEPQWQHKAEGAHAKTDFGHFKHLKDNVSMEKWVKCKTVKEAEKNHRFFSACHLPTIIEEFNAYDGTNNSKPLP